MLVDVHLPLLLEAERVDDRHSQSEGFSGVTMGAQGVDAGARCWDVVCVVGGKTEGGQDKKNNKKQFSYLSLCFLLIRSQLPSHRLTTRTSLGVRLQQTCLHIHTVLSQQKACVCVCV